MIFNSSCRTLYVSLHKKFVQMKKRLGSILKITGIVLIVLIVVVVILANVMMNHIDESDAVSELQIATVRYEQHYVEHEGFRINTYRIGDPSLPKALLIHGSPGHWSDWINVLIDKRLLGEMCLIAMDRPGYGNTEMPPSNELVEQANVAASVMSYYCADDACFTVAGHSYGGAVVEQILLDHPNTTARAVYVAGTLSPDHQGRKWYNYVAAMSLVNWMVPKIMRASNLEMTHLQSDLRKNSSRIASIKQPIVFIQGTEDVLVPLETVDFYKEMKPDGVTYIIVEGMNHFVPWSNPKLIVDALLRR
jgi:pimeloyl-ACP methyl ester carboxylesterase